jgi:hypothetical protein
VHHVRVVAVVLAFCGFYAPATAAPITLNYEVTIESLDVWEDWRGSPYEELTLGTPFTFDFSLTFDPDAFVVDTLPGGGIGPIAPVTFSDTPLAMPYDDLPATPRNNTVSRYADGTLYATQQWGGHLGPQPQPWEFLPDSPWMELRFTILPDGSALFEQLGVVSFYSAGWRIRHSTDYLGSATQITGSSEPVITSTDVPEPSTLVLLFTPAAALIAKKRKA